MNQDAADALRGSRILVTGGSGFIGRQFVSALGALGASVRVLDLVPYPDPSVDMVEGDIAEEAVMDTALDGGFDAIVHLAAVTSVLKSVEYPELTYRTNVLGTQRVLEGARSAGVGSLVFASTNAVTGPVDAPAITEQAPLRPLTPYGATKAAAEMLMSSYTSSYEIRCTTLRLTNVYGVGMQAKDSIVARLMRAVRLGNAFEVYGDGRQVRDYVHVSDVFTAVRLALTDASWHGAVVVGAGKSLSVLEVIDVVRQVTGADVPVRYGPARSGEMPAVIVDAARARGLGWLPRRSFADGVAEVWEEWKLADLAGAIPLPGGAGLQLPVGGAG